MLNAANLAYVEHIVTLSCSSVYRRHNLAGRLRIRRLRRLQHPPPHPRRLPKAWPCMCMSAWNALP